MTYGVNAAKNRNYEDQAIATIHASLDAGIYFLDTGRLLRNGHNEMLVGRAYAIAATTLSLASNSAPCDRHPAASSEMRSTSAVTIVSPTRCPSAS